MGILFRRDALGAQRGDGENLRPTGIPVGHLLLAEGRDQAWIQPWFASFGSRAGTGLIDLLPAGNTVAKLRIPAGLNWASQTRLRARFTILKI